MNGRGAVKYLEDDKYYLIESPEEKGKYIGCLAVDEGDIFAMEYARAIDDNVTLFNKSGEKVGYKEIASGKELSAYLGKLTEFIRSYNGQETYYEPDTNFVLPSEFTVIP